MASPSELATHYLRWINELWNGDVNQLVPTARDIVSEDFVGHWPGQPQLVTGPDALAEVIRQGRFPFKDVTFEVQLGPVVSGDLVSGRWVAHGFTRLVSSLSLGPKRKRELQPSSTATISCVFIRDVFVSTG